MKQILIVTVAATCLGLIVYSLGRSSGHLPALSISEGNTTKPFRHHWKWSLNKPNEVGDLCVGEIPDEGKELATVLRYLHSSTIQAFEASPRFGGNRGGFGGGQFGGGSRFGGSYGEAKEARKPPTPLPKHGSIREQDTRDRRWIYNGITSMKGYDEQWTWLEEMRGITGRGFVYKSRDKSHDRHVVGMPDESSMTEFLDRVTSSDPSTDLSDRDRVWELAELQLIGLFMHSKPVAYDKHLMMNDSEQMPRTRDLDTFETESIKNLRAGAERVMAWNDDDKCLQVLGAIRAKESCRKCHDVRPGYLLGAFTYRIKQATEQ